MTKASPGAILTLAIVAGIGLAILIFIASTLSAGPRELSQLENINGVPYPVVDGTTTISEQLAHADLYLNQPVFAKTLELTITFNPGNLSSLAVGIRDSAFWLSYDPVVLFNGTTDEVGNQLITRTITIPLTDKLQEPDRSLDLMFFATPPEGTVDLAERLNDTSLWELTNVSTTVVRDQPSLGNPGEALQLADFLFSIVRRERAL